MSEQGWPSPSGSTSARGIVRLGQLRRVIALSSESGALKLGLPPGWQPLRGWVFLVAALFVLNVATYVALTRPLWFDVTAQSRALEAGRQARLLLEPALAEARTNYGLVLQAETDLEELHSRVASSATNLSSVIGSLEERLQAVGMQFDRGTYAQERIDELDLLLLQMTVPLSGRYSAVRELVESLAAGDEFMAIDQVGLMSPDQAAAGGSLRVELQLVAFLPTTQVEPGLESGNGTEPADGEEVELPAAEGPEPVAGEDAAPPVAEGVDPAAGEEAEPADGEEARPATDEESKILAGETPAPAIEEGASLASESLAEGQVPERSGGPEARPVSDISPVQRAGELQARLASLPPLPYPAEAYDVRLDDLNTSREVSDASARNLFDFVRQPPPPAAERPQADPRPEGAGGRRRNQGGGQEQAVSSLPSISLRLLGIVRVGAVRYASLTDGTELHVAAEGSSLPGGYQIVEVGIDYAEIKLGEQQVRLTLES